MRCGLFGVDRAAETPAPSTAHHDDAKAPAPAPHHALKLVTMKTPYGTEGAAEGATDGAALGNPVLLACTRLSIMCSGLTCFCLFFCFHSFAKVSSLSSAVWDLSPQGKNVHPDKN